jgi:hypothetical protein
VLETRGSGLGSGGAVVREAVADGLWQSSSSHSPNADRLSTGLPDLAAPPTLAAVKHLTIADKSLLVGDEVANVLVQYATLLGKMNSADNVIIRSIGIDGEEVEANYLLNSGTVMMAESTHSKLPEPENGEALSYMQDRLRHFEDYAFPDPDTFGAD